MSPEFIPYLGLAWVAFIALLSAAYRTNKGKPVLFWTISDAEFIVHFASGHKGRSLFYSLGGASSCLVVAVAHGRFVVRPWFPFNLMFLPEIFGLECDIPLDRVVSVELPFSRFSVRRIMVRYRDEFLQDHSLSLRFRDPERLMERLQDHGVQTA